MSRKTRHSFRALLVASAGLLLVGTFGITTVAAAAGRTPAENGASRAPAKAQDARLRHAVAMPFFSFRRGG